MSSVAADMKQVFVSI